MNPFRTLPPPRPATGPSSTHPETDPTTPPEELRRLATDRRLLGAVLRNPNAPAELLFDRWPTHPEAFLENPIVALWRLQGHLMPFDTEQRGWRTPGLDALQWPKEKYRRLCVAIAAHLCREGRFEELEHWVPGRSSWLDMQFIDLPSSLALTRDPEPAVRLKLVEKQAKVIGEPEDVRWRVLRAILLKDRHADVAATLAKMVRRECEQRMALDEGVREEERHDILRALARNPHLHPSVLQDLLLRCSTPADGERLIEELRNGSTDRPAKDRHAISIALGPEGVAYAERDRLRYHDVFTEVARQRSMLLPLLAAHPGVQGVLRAELMAHPDPAVHLDALKRTQFHLRYHRAAAGEKLPRHRGRITSCLVDRPADPCPLCRAADAWIADENATEAHKALAANPILPVDMAERLLAKGDGMWWALLDGTIREVILKLLIRRGSAHILIQSMRYLANKYGSKKLLQAHPDPGVRMALAEALTMYYRDRSGVREQLAVDPDKRVRLTLLKGLRTSRQVDRKSLALLRKDKEPLIRFSLAMSRKGRHHKLNEMLRDPLPGIRYAAVRSLHCTGRNQLFLASDPYPRIRLLVARDFHNADGPYAQRTTGINHWVRNYHRRSIHSPVWEAYWSLVPDDPHVPVRRVAAATIDLPVSVLERLVNDPDPEVRALLLDRPVWHTAKAARARHWKLKLPDPRHAHRAKPYVRAQLATLTNLAPSRLEQFAADPHWYVRARLAFNPRTSPALLERLAADPDPLVAGAAQRARTFRKL